MSAPDLKGPDLTDREFKVLGIVVLVVWAVVIAGCLWSSVP